jgi:hypothetical protein
MDLIKIDMMTGQRQVIKHSVTEKEFHNLILNARKKFGLENIYWQEAKDKHFSYKNGYGDYYIMALEFMGDIDLNSFFRPDMYQKHYTHFNINNHGTRESDFETIEIEGRNFETITIK